MKNTNAIYFGTYLKITVNRIFYKTIVIYS